MVLASGEEVVPPKYPWMWNGEPLDEGEFVRWRDAQFKMYEEAAREGRINEVEHARKRNALLARCNERRDAEITLSHSRDPLAPPTLAPNSGMWPGEPQDQIAFDQWRMKLSRSYERAHTSGTITTATYSRWCNALLMRSNERNFEASRAKNEDELARSGRKGTSAPGSSMMLLQEGVGAVARRGMTPEPERRVVRTEESGDVERLERVFEGMEEGEDEDEDEDMVEEFWKL